jgi:hypothetical protein
MAWYDDVRGFVFRSSWGCSTTSLTTGADLTCVIRVHRRPREKVKALMMMKKRRRMITMTLARAKPSRPELWTRRLRRPRSLVVKNDPDRCYDFTCTLVCATVHVHFYISIQRTLKMVQSSEQRYCNSRRSIAIVDMFEVLGEGEVGAV